MIYSMVLIRVLESQPGKVSRVVHVATVSHDAKDLRTASRGAFDDYPAATHGIANWVENGADVGVAVTPEWSRAEPRVSNRSNTTFTGWDE